jgi:hypothetical protein
VLPPVGYSYAMPSPLSVINYDAGERGVSTSRKKHGRGITDFDLD